jgi:hypothetical protein
MHVGDQDPREWAAPRPVWPSVIRREDVGDSGCIEQVHDFRTAHERCEGCAIEREVREVEERYERFLESRGASA